MSSYTRVENGLTAETVAKHWAGYGIQDLVFEFVMLDAWREYKAFFLEQGFEKICKAYLLANRASEFKGLPFSQAKAVIEKIATKYGHKLKKMMKDLSQIKPQLNDLLQKKYDARYTGHEIISILERGFIESRYIVANPASQNYRIERTDMCWDPMYSSALGHFVYEVASSVLRYIADDFNVQFPQDNPLPLKINDHDWTRFRNLFPY
jgi:hypothetical protein